MRLLKSFTVAILTVIATIGGANNLALAVTYVPFSSATFVDTPYQFSSVFFLDSPGISDGSQITNVRSWHDDINMPRDIRYWDLDVTVNEKDGIGLVEDTLQVVISAQHLISPLGPDHLFDTDPNPNGLFISASYGALGQYEAGLNIFRMLDIEPHPSMGHINLLKAAIFADVAENQKDITGYRLYISGVHTIPIPASMPLFLSGLIGIGFMARRKYRKGAA